MKRALTILGLIVILGLNRSGLAKADPVSLKYRMATGAHYQYQMTVQTETVQQIWGQPVDRKETWSIRYGITVLSGSNNKSGILLRVTYDSIDYQFSNAFLQYAYKLYPDCSGLPAGLQPYAELVGSEFHLKLQNCSKTNMPEKRPQSVNSDLRQLLSPANPEAYTVNFMFHELIHNLFPVYPKSRKALQPGDCWKERLTVSNGQVAPKLQAVYELTATSGDQLQVELETPSGCSLKQKFASKVNQQVVAKNIVNLTGTARGSFRIAKVDSLPLEGKIRLDLAGEIKKSGLDIPTTLKLDVNYRLINQSYGG